jgi:nicotinic acid mononucleotide adenylyltransferase
MAEDTIHKSSAAIKKAVFAFGRMQPPTEGHAYLVRSVIEFAGEDADPYIFPTSTVTELGKAGKRRKTAKASNAPPGGSVSAPPGGGAGAPSVTKSAEARELAEAYNNPLTIDQKVKWLKKMFPKDVRIINTTKQESKTIFKALDHLLAAGYKDITVVVGADRKEDFEKMFSNASLMAACAAKEATLGIRILPRPEAAISGTKVRTMAARGKISAFRHATKTGLMTDADTKEMMNEVRMGMGLEPIESSLEGGTRKNRRTR